MYMDFGIKCLFFMNFITILEGVRLFHGKK